MGTVINRTGLRSGALARQRAGGVGASRSSGT